MRHFKVCCLMDLSTNELFYHNLQADTRSCEFADISSYVELPDDWYVIVADIEGSTNAIEAGHYKNVNTLGAAAIAAVLNVNRKIDIPFIFGGDGATFAVPSSMLDQIRIALLGVKELAKEFQLEFRIGMALCAEFKASGHLFFIKKIQTSEFVTQSSFIGDGWSAVEDAIKNPQTRFLYELTKKANEIPLANFEGFECKWEDVSSSSHHKLSIIISEVSYENGKEIDLFFDEIIKLYGSLQACHPLTKHNLNLSTTPKKLLNETKVRVFNKSYWFTIGYILKSTILAIFGKYFLFKFGLSTKGIDGKKYIDELIANSDVMKFDGMLKMIINSTDEKSNCLIDYLAKRYRSGKIVFGIHRSDSAILTCLVFSLRGKHFHFVDGSNGGYAMAAKQLKAQLKEKKSEQHNIVEVSYQKSKINRH